MVTLDLRNYPTTRLRPLRASLHENKPPNLNAPRLEGPEGNPRVLECVVPGEDKMSAAPSRWFLIAPILLAIAFLLLYPPVHQDQSYHYFADQRTFLGIPNFWNVVSNAGFLVVGIMGLLRFKEVRSRILFAGVLATSIGSSYYHWAPQDSRLVWDRLPMTIVFMSLLSIVISMWFDQRLGSRLLFPLLVFGVATIVWWQLTGDLRPYGIAQFGPLLILIPAMYFSKSVRGLWPVLLFYVAAKLAEEFDQSLYNWVILSGHTWKHVLAALATFWILRGVGPYGLPPSFGSAYRATSNLENSPNAAPKHGGTPKGPTPRGH